MALSKKSNEVAERKGTELANPSALFSQRAGAGLENVDMAKDLLIPRLTIIQGLSPQLSKTHEKYDPKAVAGNIYDVGLRLDQGESLPFLPVHFVKQWLEWAPRNSGKGLVAVHTDKEILKKCTPDKDKKNKLILNGTDNYIVETMQFFGINLKEGMNYQKCFLPMSSTQLKKGRLLLTLANAEVVKRDDGTEFTPPIYYRIYNIGTAPESNNEGDWIGWKVERGDKLQDHPDFEKLFQAAAQFSDSIAKGEAKADISDLNEEEGAAKKTDDGRM